MSEVKAVKWTLVTGAAKGLGAALALKLASEGKSVVIHYRNSGDGAAKVAKTCQDHGVKAEIIQGDFSSKESTETFLREYSSRFPETENVINNVGAYLVKSSLNTTVDEWHALFAVNFVAPLMIIQHLIPSIKKYKGNIINIGMVGTQHVASDTHSTAYTITKTSLAALTKALARELAPSHVRVNMVSPGYLENSVNLPNESKFPMGRPGRLEEVADMVAYLLSEKSSYITGQNIEIAGGVKL